MKIIFSQDAADILERMPDRRRSRRVAATIVALLGNPEPAESHGLNHSGLREIKVGSHTVLYRYSKDRALIQIILVMEQVRKYDDHSNN